MLGDGLVCTHLYVPPQSATFCTVWTHGSMEVELCCVCEEGSHLVMGWIHLHPTFPASLSSIDQHTCASWMIGNEKLVSLVVDGRDNSLHSYIMSDYGLAVCAKCIACTAEFHEHPQDDALYRHNDITILQDAPCVL